MNLTQTRAQRHEVAVSQINTLESLTAVEGPIHAIDLDSQRQLRASRYGVEVRYSIAVRHARYPEWLASTRISRGEAIRLLEEVS